MKIFQSWKYKHTCKYCGTVLGVKSKDIGVASHYTLGETGWSWWHSFHAHCKKCHNQFCLIAEEIPEGIKHDAIKRDGIKF